MEKAAAAIITGMIPSGVGIIRVSGENAGSICDRAVRIRPASLLLARPRLMYHGYAVQPGTAPSSECFPPASEAILDECLAVYMPAPHSYTGEDTVEIQCHGGPYLLQKVLEAVLRAGAVPAEPGEFTKRAFLNGRLDLSQAEAVMGLISSETEYARSASVRLLQGDGSSVIRDIRARLLEETAHIEAALDDPEHLSLDGFAEALQEKLQAILAQLERGIRLCDTGRLFSDGIPTAIIGRPNVGKSSLMNALLREDRAIVTCVPGTTRDILEEKLRLGDLLLQLSDTAGIRQAADEVEKIGVERARRKAEEAQLILYVLDCSLPLQEEDISLLERFRDRKVLLLLNKSDLNGLLNAKTLEQMFAFPVLELSAKTGEGIDRLEEAIRQLFFRDELRPEDHIISGVRQKERMLAAAEAVRRVLESISLGLPEDFFTVDLMEAYRELGFILGEEVSEDLVNEIFNKFCMGK